MKRKEYRFIRFLGEPVNRGYQYQDTPLYSLNQQQVEEYWREFDLHQTAEAINREHGITETDNYIISYQIDPERRFHFSFYSFFNDGAEKKKHPQKDTSKYKYNMSSFHEEVAHNREIVDGVCFLHFSTEKIVITYYRRYFDKSHKETDVIPIADLKHLELHEMKVYDSFLPFRKKMCADSRYVLCFEFEGYNHCFNFSASSFPQLLGYNPIRKTNIAGIPFQNKNFPHLKEQGFYLPPEKMKPLKCYYGKLVIITTLILIILAIVFYYKLGLWRD